MIFFYDFDMVICFDMVAESSFLKCFVNCCDVSRVISGSIVEFFIIWSVVGIVV